ncbi:MAG: hypothetical protein SW127_17395, partial [Actinomycetota bacterium]|nr:hypothetical protein [Actinomycetota bacterium]
MGDRRSASRRQSGERRLAGTADGPQWLGKGANAQEQCYIINSHLEGFDITAHGAKIIEADLGKNV